MRKGSKMTDEQKKKISESLTGKKVSTATRKKISESLKGKTFSEERKKKISVAISGEKHPMYGKKHSVVAKKKMSESKKGKTLSTEHKKKLSESRMGKKNSFYKHGRSKTKEYICAISAKRRAAKLNQTPDNANIDKIQLYYTICAYLNDELETPAWHVDHIQPISKGGFHHEDNLQILTATINLEKHNKYPLTEEEEIKYKGLRI